ncbi:hypothetical protein M5G22_25870 [Pseudomonas sp. TNT2022 ID233]|uniref:hypothetical protein n=1 Tax=Pseudomonas aphyarum TaxID=2942629 RepID=UPI0023603991|nr:hypothetical protein [Pseudomonas aphyarum]MDD1141003.1 hypothetical protein [Pseudomonas aphyarum]
MGPLNSQAQLIHRVNTRIITLHQVLQEFAEPELIQVQLSRRLLKKPLDLGSLAYSCRGKNVACQDDRGTPVLISSFIESRRELIVRLLLSFVGLRETSVLLWFKQTEMFIDWLDSQEYREIFGGEIQAQKAYRDYTAYLNHRIKMQEISPVTASGYQRSATRLIELLFPERFHYILLAAVKIVGRRGSAVRSNANVHLYKDVFLSIAQSGSDFVLRNKPYPCVVSVRDYEVVMFPATCGAVSPFRNTVPIYNARERRIATLEEYKDVAQKIGRKNLRESNIVRAIQSAEKKLITANNNDRHWHRVYMAELAAKAYAGLFLLITGATPAEFAQFTYRDALEVERSPLKKELSAVKFRAGGKATLYNIGQKNGLPLLKDYLKLRDWILNGRHAEQLFFSTSAFDAGGEPIGFNDFKVSEIMSKLYRSISGVFIESSVPILSAREMRKNKSVGQHSAGLSLATVAQSLNHTEAMNISTYAEASSEQQDVEFSRFWKSLRLAASMVLERGENVSDNRVSVAAGHCDRFKHPTPIINIKATMLEPNCSTQYGCLYCTYYACHADEEDLHKLMSLQYVINAVRATASDPSHAEILYKELSIRIEFVIEALCGRSESIKCLVEAVKYKVFESGVLTPFWERRLSRYESMGVVF